MTRPVRLQLSRRVGFRLQEHSRAVNGLAAVNVARPSKWGNPFKVGSSLHVDGVISPIFTRNDAVDAFRALYEVALEKAPTTTRASLSELRGKNLACWCKPGAPCHADVLLELANGPLPADPQS